MKISIIVPAFNEKETVEEIVRRIDSVSLPIDKEIIIVDDASFDGTNEILTRLNKELNFTLKIHQKNQGKGSAIKTGLAVATGDFVIIQDADLEYDPADYPCLLEPLLKGDVDVVYGSRNLVKNPRFTAVYFWGGQFLTLVLNVLFGAKLNDINTGYKVFRREILTDLNLEEKRFAFCEEVTCKLLKRGCKIKEVPIHYTPRGFEGGKKIRWWRDGLRGLFVIIKYRIK